MSDQRDRTGERLRRRGFDRSRYDRASGHYRVACSQCEAAVINGVACHEAGCPNYRRPADNEEGNDDADDDDDAVADP
jgi:hypothetical protein